MGEFILAAIILVVAGTFIGGWLFMLTIGVVHGEWLPMMPTIGYWSAVKVSAMLSVTFGLYAGFSKSLD